MSTETVKRTTWLLASLLAGVALLHAYWAVGGTWGLQTAVSEGNPLPPPIASAAVMLVLLGAMLVVLGRVGIWGRSLPAWLFRWATWSLVAVLVAVALLNFSTARMWERWVFAPFAALLAMLALVVATSPERSA